MRTYRLVLLSLLSFAVCLPVFSQTPIKSVQERLGYPPTARLLVIHADDFGMGSR